MAKTKVKNAEGKKLPPRRAKFVENYLTNGGNGKKAAEDAGYAKGHAAEVEASRLLRTAEVRERIRARIAEAGVDKNEIIGTLVSHMRGDFADLLPDDEFMKQARQRGVSHLVKEVEITEHLIPGKSGGHAVVERKRKFKIHDSQAAARYLCNVFGLEKLPAPNPETVQKLDEAVRKFIEKAAAKGIEVSPEIARDKLMPYFDHQTVQ